MDPIKNLKVQAMLDLPSIAGPPSLQRTWTCACQSEFEMLLFTIQRYCKVNGDFWPLSETATAEFHESPAISHSIMKEGIAIFSIRNQLFCMIIASNLGNQSVVIRSSHEGQWLYDLLAKELRENNPWRGRLLEIVMKQNDFQVFPKAPTPQTLEDVVMDLEHRNDIRENTIERLRHGLSSGAILHGPPGGGKSLTCRSLLNEASEAGYTAVYASGRIDFDTFALLRERYFGELLLVLEDVEMYAEDRVKGIKSYFSDFLQFTSGIAEATKPMAVLVTTNHLDLLDQAIRQRPVRFNRKWHFGLPGEPIMENLLKALLPETVDIGQILPLCLDRGFTGAHVREIRDTATIIARKGALNWTEAVKQAVEIVAQHFPSNNGRAGFSG